MTDNITGKGVDIPILGIRRAVNEIWNTPKEELSEEEIKENQHLRAIFDDQVFDTANAFKLSTSQVTRNHLIHFDYYVQIISVILYKRFATFDHRCP